MFSIDGVAGGKSILAAVLAGILCLDRVFFQVMVSRPIIVSAVLGAVLGDLPTALVMGALIEILWADHLPVGVYIPPNDSLMSAVAVGSTILAGQAVGSVTKEMMALSIVLFMPLAFLARKLDQWIIAMNGTLSDRAVASAVEGRPEDIARCVRRDLGRTLVIYVGFIIVFLFMGTVVLLKAYPLLSGKIPMKALLILFWSLPLVGIAAVLNAVRQKGVAPLFTGVFFMAVLLGTLLSS